VHYLKDVNHSQGNFLMKKINNASAIKKISSSKTSHDLVDETSEDSFPASDAPSWTSGELKTHSQVEHPSTTIIFNKKTLQTLTVNGIDYHYFSLSAAEEAGLKNLSTLPFTLKILLENLLRHWSCPLKPNRLTS
jgi:aconitate hydratase